MQIIIDNLEQFKIFFDVVYDMASDILELQLLPDKMICSILDRGRSRFYHVQYDKEFFEEYAVDGVESIMVYVEDLHKLLKSTNKKDVLYLEINDPYLVAKIESENGNSRIFEFVLPSDFIESPTLPNIQLPTEFECDVGDLKQSVKDISLIGSDLYRFVVSQNNLTVMTSEDVSTKYANTVDVDVDITGSVASSFTVGYIGQILKFDKISKNVVLRVGSDMPLLYTFKDEIMGVTINGMIAPRTSEE